MDKKYKDYGPLLDCLVWNDGTEYKACLSADGDLENGIVLGEFKNNQEFAPLTKADQMNISVNVWDAGNKLEIVGMCGSHGTHVSSIAAGMGSLVYLLFQVCPEKILTSFLSQLNSVLS